MPTGPTRAPVASKVRRAAGIATRGYSVRGLRRGGLGVRRRVLRSLVLGGLVLRWLGICGLGASALRRPLDAEHLDVEDERLARERVVEVDDHGVLLDLLHHDGPPLAGGVARH